MDIIEVVSPITKYAVMIEKAEDIVYELDKLIYTAKNGRKGPVWLDIPLDIQSSVIDTSSSKLFVPKKQAFKLKEKDLKYFTNSLSESKRPVVLIGHGIRSANAIDELKTFINSYSIPLVYTPSAPDTVGSLNNDLSIGSVGAMGCSRSGNFTLQNSDLLIVLGSRLSTMTSGPDYHLFARDARVIVIDIDKNEHKKNTVKVDYLINLDLKLFLRGLLKIKLNLNFKDWSDKCLHWKRLFDKIDIEEHNTENVDLHLLSEILSRHLKSNDSVVCDSGFNEIILPSNIKFNDGSRCIHPISQGAMGYAVPAAVGVNYSSNGSVFVIVGDGSIMMNIQELETIKYNKIPLKILVINNNLYSIINKRQKELFRKRTIGTNETNGLSCTNFKDLAKLYELEYFKISSSKELDNKINEINKCDKPLLCEIIGKENQYYTEVGYSRNKDGRFQRQPLEDLAPFIDRDLFYSEMIIKPIK